MAREIKQEYIVIMAKKYGSDIYFYHWDYCNGKQWFGFIDYSSKAFSTIEEAKAKLQSLKKEGIYTETDNIYEFDSTNWLETHNFIVDKVWSNRGEKGIFIIRIPTSYYIGEKWEETLKTENLSYYTNEKNCYLYGKESSNIFGDDFYLYYESPTKFAWVKNKKNATFFSKEEAKKVQKIINTFRSKEHPYKGYVRIGEMPLHLSFKPKFQKWDEAYYINYDYEDRYIRKVTIGDVYAVHLKKRFVYEKEGFFYQYIVLNSRLSEMLEDELYSKEELISMGAVFKGDYVVFKDKKFQLF